MIYLLTISLIFMLFIIFIINKKDIASPAFIVCASFCFSSMWNVIYSYKWNLNLHTNTFWVIFGGILELVVITLFISYITDSKSKHQKYDIKVIKIEKWKKLLFLCFGLISMFLYYKWILNFMGKSWNELSDAINLYRKIKIFTNNEVTVPRLLSYSKYILISSGYFFVYILVNNFIAEKKIDVYSFFIVIVSAITTMTNGGRGGSISFILVGVADFIFLLNKRCGFKNVFNINILIKMMIFFIIFLATFKTTGTLIGRTANNKKSINAMNNFDYLAVYCGAEIKNLDTYLQEQHLNKNTIVGQQTFSELIRWLGPKLGISNSYYSLDLPYRSINEFNLGNVYTMFYPYIYDFGYEGVVWLVALMSIITQIVYEKCKKVRLKERPSLWVLIYSCLFSSLAFSFFSNQFYEQNFSRQAAINVIMWLVYIYFFCICKLVRKNGKLKIIIRR